MTEVALFAIVFSIINIVFNTMLIAVYARATAQFLATELDKMLGNMDS